MLHIGRRKRESPGSLRAFTGSQDWHKADCKDKSKSVNRFVLSLQSAAAMGIQIQHSFNVEVLEEFRLNRNKYHSLFFTGDILKEAAHVKSQVWKSERMLWQCSLCLGIFVGSFVYTFVAIFFYQERTQLGTRMSYLIFVSKTDQHGGRGKEI